MTIKRLVQIVAGALLGTMLVCALVFTLGVNSIRLGGTHGKQIDLANGLEADTLPPALFVLEPYSEALELTLEPGREDIHIRRLRELRGEFDKRHDYWAKSPLPNDLRDLIGSATNEPAQRFWDIVEHKLIPAAERRDADGTRRAMLEVTAAFDRHQQAAEALIKRVRAYRDEMGASADTALGWTASLLIGLGLLMFGGLAAASVLLMRRVVVPVGQISDVTTQLAEGGDVPVPFTELSDELGSLARAVDHFRRAAADRAERDSRDATEKRQMVESLAEVLTRMADGDLRHVLQVSFSGEYQSVGENLNLAISTLRNMVQEVVVNAGSIRGSAAEISAASADLSARTQSNAAAIEETTAALANVDSRIVSTRDAAESTAESANRAQGAVAGGLEKAQSAAAFMAEVRDAAASVDGVMEALDKIAFQTRVLAMNAAVEAGHAGEAGKGFAVVADLVSQLAGRAEEEAKKAREQLTATSAKIAQAVGSVGQVEQEFAGIVDDVAKVTELVEKLTEDARAQASAVAEISAAMRQMDISTQQNAAMVEETSAAANTLLADAQKLVDQADRFRWERREHATPVAVERRGRGQQANAVHAGHDRLAQTYSDAA